MRRIAIVISLLLCWIALSVGANPAVALSATTQDVLLASYQKIQQYLTLPTGTSAEQRALVALNIAVAQSQPLDESVDVTEVLRKASTFTTYGVMSDTFYTWNGVSWVGSHRSTYTYTGIRQTGEVGQTWSGSAWVNSSNTIITFNVDGTLNTMMQQDWSTDHWVNTMLMTLTYSGGLTATMLVQIWSGTAWENSALTTMTYSGGKLASTLTQGWETDAWVNSLKSDYTYTGDNLTDEVSQMWTGDEWMNFMRVTFSYNVSNLKTQQVQQSWGGISWTNSNKYDYTYNGSGNEILRISSDWGGSAWTAMEADTTKWSGDDETEVVHNHFAVGSLSRTQFSYDANHNGILDLGQNWLGGIWMNASRAVYVYAALAVEVGDGRTPSEFELSQNYPNPFNPITAIRYSLHRPAQVNITVFNLLGQEVKTLENGMQSAGTYETTWDGTNRTGEQVASGIYFYRIKAGENIETRKMLLLK
jgi:hypothetical protein